VTDEPKHLGFRGFIVETNLEDKAWRAGLPQRFAVARPDPTLTPPSRATVDGAITASLRAAESDAIEFLLQTAQRAVDNQLLETVCSSIELEGVDTDAEEEPDAETRVESAAVSLESLLEGPMCEPFLTPIRTGFWNYPPILLRNNCYNYMANFASSTMAQPGRRVGQPYTAFECGAVLQAAMADGCLTTCDGAVRVIALGIWPDTDFHWWRLHPGGVWAHKIGTTMVTNRDNRGRILANGLTPETCDRGPYTTFCNYYYAPLGMWVL
jgi:hypothetical protein